MAFTAARMTELTRMRRKDEQIDEQKMMLQTKIVKGKRIRQYSIELRRYGTSYCPVRAFDTWLNDENTLKEEGSAIWINIEKKKRPLSPQECGQILRNVLDDIEVEKQYGGVSIRHSMLTKLRREGIKQEEVNIFTGYAPESNVVNVFYNKPVGRDLSALLLLKQII
ncbi:MAG: hypothetical protein EZS28_050269 [Streblomastix strix]|uniref:Tyr recombinase domain-containing protein n=1 Tax=Streblomastix strix TaxID=222440 RepID=A0A5J4T760_9EUKA|nr:MAG: hypothetical protein EZS28_050269 [Streblomastix strix]